MSETYRSPYGVTETVRPPDGSELGFIHRRRDEDLAIERRAQFRRVREALGTAAFMLGVGLVGEVMGIPPLRFAAAIAAAVSALTGLLAWPKAEAALAAYQGRWTPPDAEWRVHETRIRSRSLTFVASEGEDYTTWLLFEIPGEDWVGLDDLWLPRAPSARGSALAREELVLRWLRPADACMEVVASGDPIARHGALDLAEVGYEGGDEFARAIAAGFGWPVEDAESASSPGPIRRFADRELPPWVRDVVRDR